MEDFGKVIQDIKYELQMLSYTAEQLKSIKENILLRNAMLESFLIHARTLIEFFYPTKLTKAKKGIYAARYIGNWDQIRPRNPLNKEKEMMHKWLAHISQARYKKTEKPEWKIRHIYEELELLMKLFRENLKKDGEQIVIKEIKLPDECICASGEALGRALYIGRINK
jgi:hypothetical protein